MIWISFGILFIIFLEDLLQREVHWFLFPALLLSFLVQFWSELVLEEMLLSFALLLVLLFGLSLYLLAKTGSLKNPLQGYFSLGDVLFLLALIPVFKLHAYLMFFIVGTLFTLLVYGISSTWMKDKTIPYAGYMAVFSIPVLLYREQFVNLIDIVYGIN